MQQAAATLSRSDWRLILLASLGGALEFYDFVVYSQFAQYIGRNFFPNTDAMVSLIVSFSVFAVGYFARPLGGIFFSHIGDRIGRRRVLIITILAMSAATAGIGLLPTYAQWGITASVLLVLLRIIQGFCLGGELPGAIAYVVETAPRRSGFSVGIVFFCVNTGVLLAALLSLVVHGTLTVEEVGEWGWRIGFLVGGVLGLVSFVLRLSLEESREFARIRSIARASAVPMAEVIRTHPAAIVVGVGILAVTAGFNGLLFAMPAYLERTMGYEAIRAIEAQNAALIVMSFGLLFVAWLERPHVAQNARADRHGVVDRAIVALLQRGRGAQRKPARAVRFGRTRRLHLRWHGHRNRGRSLPDAHPLLGCRAVLQLELHALQRARARRRGTARAQHGRRRHGGVLHGRLRRAVVRRGARDPPLRRPDRRRPGRPRAASLGAVRLR